MSIQVTCPSCHARFNVSDKFAGQTGPCPKCKKPIRVPEKEEEVVVHAPDEFGPKDGSGRAVLKPVERSESQITPVMIALIAAFCLVVLIVAFLLGRSDGGVSIFVLGIGAVLLGPPVAFAGYGLLRDHELEPHRGVSLMIRCLVCGLIYAALWGVFFYFKGSLLEGEVELFHLMFIAPPMIAAGAVAGLACLELDFISGALHYGLYLLVTILLRLLMGLPPL
ncbi:MAG: hypothetical protein P8N76_10300 [Pirellulaceae bacterium]|nr:hypothetical protein [Pirellulaceae bacterium]